MADIHTIEERVSGRLRGRDRRSLNLSTKLTLSEAKVIENAAVKAGKTPSEWAREVLLRDARGTAAPMSSTVLTEIVGLQLFLTNVLSPIARGERITTEHFQEIMRQVRGHKHQAAAEILGQVTPTPAEAKK